MIKHVVMWQLKDAAEGNSKSENKKIMREKLEGLLGKIDALKSLEVGENFNPTDAAFDMALITTHESKEGLAAYAAHPEHQAVEWNRQPGSLVRGGRVELP